MPGLPGNENPHGKDQRGKPTEEFVEHAPWFKDLQARLHLLKHNHNQIVILQNNISDKKGQKTNQLFEKIRQGKILQLHGILQETTLDLYQLFFYQVAKSQETMSISEKLAHNNSLLKFAEIFLDKGVAIEGKITSTFLDTQGEEIPIDSSVNLVIREKIGNF